MSSERSPWPFRLSFSALAITALVTHNVVAAVILVAVAIVYAAERS